MRSSRSWLFLALAVSAAIALTEAALSDMSCITAIIAGPLLVAIRGTARATIAFACYAGALVTIVGAVNMQICTADYLEGWLAVIIGGCFGALAARMRAQRDCALARMTHVAELTQRAIMRPIPPTIGGVAFATHYQSATQEALIGGDLYDTVLTPCGLRLIVGDVKGKGLDAVQLAAAVLGVFREIAFTEPDLAQLARKLDARVGDELGIEDFVTVLLAEFVNGEVRLVNCGHPPPLRVGQRLDLLAPPHPAPPLGLGPDPAVQRARLGPNERLLLYTDGLIEARGPDRVMFSLDHRVHPALTAPSLTDAVDGLLHLVLEHTQNNLRDDLLLVLGQPDFDRAGLQPRSGSADPRHRPEPRRRAGNGLEG
jgi:sigma-B regulation protein RsbU (phosphoserine phosphatase)